jgi:dTDP-4-dehydrorhamnose 3,5-epimerase
MSNKFDFCSTEIAGLFVIERKPIVHDLGFFARFFCIEEFQEAGLSKPIVQINQTFTKKKDRLEVCIFNFHHMLKLR